MAKLKLAIYWAAGCGGCDTAVLDLHEKILDVAKAADIVFWPIALDFKTKDVEAMPDKYIDVCLFNGAIRNSENEHMAKLLRQKSKILVAFGSCSHLGGIPGLANFSNKEEIFKIVYRDTASTDNPDFVTPQEETKISTGDNVTLPEFYDTVKHLQDVVDVDYFQPGCPPAVPQIWAVIEAIVAGKLPPKGSVIGAIDKAVCEECERVKEEKKIKDIYRPHEIIPDPEKCFLEQGIICMGSATRGGCGALCIKSNMPCRGCYGPLPGVIDQGAKVLSAITSIIDSNDPEEIENIVSKIKDPTGTFYRFSLPASLLKRKVDVQAKD